MVFSSNVFLMAFLPVTLLLYFLVPKRYLKVRNAVLLAVSLFFYGWGEPKYILVMLASILFNYFLALAIGRQAGSGRNSRLLLFVTVAGNLGILGFFKYTDFLIDTVSGLLGGALSPLNIALPIGISFYTFQTMSYVIDVYWGKVKAQKDFIAFASYVTLFPQLIAGPIVRYSDVEVQLLNRQTSSGQVAEGIRRFIIGFGKKVLLANQIYIVWKELSAMEELSAASAWLGAVAFTFQIYFDFSGYSDMAIGLGKILGFDYLENFNYPYISRSITEFWRRWHMSLSSWFKEYVYVPLGGNRSGLKKQIFNIAVVWALTGLWHGASWNFVAWGVYFGVILIIEKLWLLRLLDRLPKAAGHIYSLILIVLGWVIFAIEDLGQVGTYMTMMFGASGTFTDDAFFYFLQTRGWFFLFCAVGSTPLPAAAAKWVVSKLESSGSQLTSEVVLGLLETAVLLGSMVLSVAFLVSGSYNPFLYFRF